LLVGTCSMVNRWTCSTRSELLIRYRPSLESGTASRSLPLQRGSTGFSLMCIAEEPCEATSLTHGSERGGIREGSPLLSSIGLIWSTPTASVNRPSTGPRHASVIRNRPTAGPGLHPVPPGAAHHRGRAPAVGAA